VNVIGFTVAGDQPAIHGLADLTEMPGKPVPCGAIEYAASILGDTDQMHGKKRNAMSTAPKVLQRQHVNRKRAVNRLSTKTLTRDATINRKSVAHTPM